MTTTYPLTTPPSVSGTPGYLRALKTLAVSAIQQAFTLTYPESDPEGGSQPVYSSLEFPVSPAAYPALWVNYAPAQLQTAGINYTEVLNDVAYTRWRFSGTIEFTCAALTNNERDMLYDQLVSVLAFASQSAVPSPFREVIEASPLIESTWSFDTLDSAGHSDAPGTPWGTDEVIYEDTISIQVIGEFTSDPVSGSLADLAQLREITVTGTPVETMQGPVMPGGFTIEVGDGQTLSPP